MAGSLVTISVLGAPAALANSATGDTTATQGARACTWTMSTAAISKTVTFNSGSFTMTGLVNKLVTAPRQYEQTGTASGEFSFLWDRTAFTGASGGWFIDRSKKGSCNDR